MALYNSSYLSGTNKRLMNKMKKKKTEIILFHLKQQIPNWFPIVEIM